ncbi:hypothetical protein C8255_26470, partial [filamentous cyanobacterium CCP3]
MTRLNRRRFLTTAGTAAVGTVLLHACSQGGSNQASESTE